MHKSIYNIYNIQEKTMILQKKENISASNLFICAALKGIYSLQLLKSINKLSTPDNIINKYGICGQIIDDIIDCDYDRNDNIHTLSTDFPLQHSFKICHYIINDNDNKSYLQLGFNLYLMFAKAIIGDKNKSNNFRVLLRDRFIYHLVNLYDEL